MRTPLQANGFRPGTGRMLGRERRNASFAELIASLGLGLATLVAVTVVSAGIARADVAMNVIDNETGLFAIALVVGLLFAAMGGLSLTLPGHRHRPRH